MRLRHCPIVIHLCKSIGLEFVGEMILVCLACLPYQAGLIEPANPARLRFVPRIGQDSDAFQLVTTFSVPTEYGYCIGVALRLVFSNTEFVFTHRK